MTDYNMINNWLKDVMEEARSLGIPLSDRIDNQVLINGRAKKRLGCCRMKDGSFRIEVSSLILEGGKPAVKEILAHEILHTCPGCQNHSSLWKAYGNQMNQAFGYQIRRTISASLLGIQEQAIIERPARYIITCLSCGTVFRRQRKSPLVTRTHRYRCRCGGELLQERVKEPCRK